MMKCMVIDDEPFALSLIEGYVTKTPFIELAGSFSNPFKALTFLMNNPVELVFLDINMPELSGIQLLKSLSVNRPMVVFTTAYPEFGAESYEYDAIDYLLKPIKYERFLKAVNKAMELAGHTSHYAQDQTDNILPEKSEHVLLKSGTQVNKIRTSQILYIEGAGNYMNFYTKEKKIMTLLSMTEVLELLPPNQFVRIHKSYVVNTDCIDVIEKHRVIINKQSIPIGSTYRGMDLKFK